MLSMRKQQILEHRQQRRELLEKLDNLTDPMFLYHAEKAKEVEECNT